MTEQHRSRIGWKAFTAPITPTSRQRWRSAWMVASILNMVLSGLLFAYVLVLHDAAMAERQRASTEQQRIQQQVIHNNCALMDALPAGGPLTPLRATYHCGPGLPTKP